MSKHHKKLERMLLFYEVAQQLSFSKAAEQLGISRSYLSQQIRSLERDLSSQLLVRTTRKVRLTTEGQKVLLQAQAMHSGLVELERELQHSDQDVAGVLRITAPTVFAQTILVNACQQFKQRYPEVKFEIEVGHQLEDLNQRNFDLAIRVTEHPPQNMIARKLMPYSHWVVASPEYLSANPVPQRPSDLTELECLAFPEWRDWQFQRYGQTEVIEAQGWLSVADNNILRAAALNGQGVIRIPEHLLWGDVKEGRLQRLLSDYQIEPRQVWMLYPPKIGHSTRLQLFVEFLQEYVGDAG